MQTLTSQPIAIIGIAAALPGSGDDLALLSAYLEQGRDLIAPVPAARRRDGGLSEDVALSDCALLDQIDLFDHQFFGMSLRESRQMDPQQRLLLQLGCKAIWDAGYSLAQLRGSRTAVVLGAASESYSALLSAEEAPLVTGLLPAAQAGRIAYELDLRGAALTIDTACSSALTAILEASRLVANGEAELALTGAVRLMSRPPLAVVAGNEGILSPTGRARSFDASADGTALGEGGVVYLLKTLAKAQQDGDPIHAVILGGARNQDGGRSNGFAAPSAEAQEELLVEAWRAAGVNPLSLGMIEAHGTGTRLGDPIEFKALSAAFARTTERSGFCALGSVKSNIGHLDCAAGAAGLLKAVLAVKQGKRYPSAHFRTPNPLLETEHSALRLSSSTESWHGADPRRAGVSAFGLTGTNVHLVVEQAPPSAQPGSGRLGPPLLIPLSAHTEAALRRHAARLAACLDGAAAPALEDVAWVQTAGRDHRPWRTVVTGGEAAQVVAALRQIASGQESVDETGDAVAIVLLPHEGEVDAATVDACLNLLPPLRDWYLQEQRAAQTLEPALRAHAGVLLNKLLLVRALLETGVSDRHLIGHGSGNLLLDVLRGQSSVAGAAAAAAALGPVSALDPARLAQVFETISAHGAPVYLAPWAGQLAAAAGQATPARPGVTLAADGDRRTALVAALAGLYRYGVTLDWERVAQFGSNGGRRRHLPASLFEPVRCWADLPAPPAPPAPAALAPSNAPAAPSTPPVSGVAPSASDVAQPADAEQVLAGIWHRLLETETIVGSDDFFDLGGDSLMQTQLANAVKQAFGVDLNFNSVYDHPTLAGLAAHILTLLPVQPPAACLRHDPARVSAPATHSQRRMWTLQQLDPRSGAYNVSAAYVLEAGVDVEALRTALQRLSARHDIMRCFFRLQSDGLAMLVPASVEPDFDVACASLQQAEAMLQRHAERPFDLAVPGAWRVLLLQQDDGVARSWLQLVLHHAICDEWSLNQLLRELSTEYRAALAGMTSPLPLPTLRFADWAAWEHELEQEPAHQQDAVHWRRTLAQAPASLALPTDFPYGVQQDYAGAWLPLALPAALVHRMRDAARAAGGTLFTWLLTGYAAWLARTTQSQDFLIGVPTAGRHHADAEALVGCFINTLPIRIDASGEPGFKVLFERVRDALAAALEHQSYPFDLMVEQLGGGRDAARPPLVQTLLSLQGSSPGAGEPLRLGDSVLQPLQAAGAVSWFDLSAVLWDTQEGGLCGIFAYRSALFEQASIESFWQDWSALLEAGLTQPDKSIHDLLHDLAW